MYKYRSRPLLFRLKKLGTSKTVLHVGVHPDDEEIGLLSYISYKHYGRPVYWSATRGESGQNRVNNYKGDALGVYRTWESLLVREGDGGECLFGPFVDFGFSKSSDEAFSKWGKENIIRELVRAIRLVQPQIIISRWAGTSDDGHGQHQAVGQALPAAIEEAGSHDSFPEFISQGLLPWHTDKFYRSTNKTICPTGELNAGMETDGFLKINTGEYSPLTGSTYQEQAWMAYGRHQTQGMAVLPAPGDFYYYLMLIKSTVAIQGHETDLFQGLETGLMGIFSGIGSIPADVCNTIKEVEGLVGEAIAKYTLLHPSSSSSLLCDGLKLLKDLRGHILEKQLPDLEKQAMVLCLERKIEEFEEVIVLCMGLRLESLCTRAKVTPGESVWVKNRLWNFTNAPVDNVTFSVHVPRTWRVEQDYETAIMNGSSDSMVMNEVFIGNDAALSCPYWLRESEKSFIHGCPEEAVCRNPLPPASLSAECTVAIGPHKIKLSSPTLHRKAFPGGYRELPLLIVPPISLHPEFDKKIFLVSTSAQKFTLQVTARCNDEEQPADGHLELMGPEGWQIYPSSVDITLPPANGAATRAFDVIIPPDAPEGRYLLRYNIRCRNRDYGVVLTPVRMGAPGLPNPDNPATCIREELILTPAQVEIFIINARLREGQKFGYIEGAKEEILPVLQPLGVNIRQFKDADIAHGDLNIYDAIVVGPDAYLLGGQLADNAHRFLEYVEHGGTLIVQYHTYEYQGHGFAPYSFTYSRPHDRVTDENAPVTILAPDNPLFHYPNMINPKDFDNWVHDRGLYFFGRWDGRYTPLLSCADAGEPPKTGGLIICTYGRGIYLYVGYSLFRQLPAGVPGAFRLFFNMLSLKPYPGNT
jgi:LmbE family N-acetylglucosaminyl deacetylase